MSERTVADETFTPAASTTCCEPTGCADPMYSVTTAFRMAALRESSSAAVCDDPFGRLSSVVAMVASRSPSSRSAPGAAPTPGASRRWHSTLVSAGRTAASRSAGRRSRRHPRTAPKAGPLPRPGLRWAPARSGPLPPAPARSGRAPAALRRRRRTSARRWSARGRRWRRRRKGSGCRPGPAPGWWPLCPGSVRGRRGRTERRCRARRSR